MKFLSMLYSQFFYMPRKVTKTISVAKLFLSSICISKGRLVSLFRCGT